MSEDSFHLGIKALVCDPQGNVLLLQVNTAKLHNQRQAYWDLPGGRVQKGDDVLITLRREVEEELGVTELANCRPVGMVLSNIRIPIGDDSVGLILSIYRCDIPADAVITISDEHVGYDWFAPRQAAELLAVKYPQDFCEQVAQLGS